MAYCVPPRQVSTPQKDRRQSVATLGFVSGQSALSNNSNQNSNNNNIIIAVGGSQQQPQQQHPRSIAGGAGGRLAQLPSIVPSSSSSFSTAENAAPPLSGGAGSGGFSMMISGEKTGEEKVFSAVEVREARHGNKNGEGADAQARKLNRATSNVSSDADRIRKLEQELRKSQDVVRKKTADIETLKEKHKQALADSSQRAEQARTDALDNQKQQHDATVKQLSGRIDDLTAQAGKLSEELKKRTAEENEANRRRDGEFSASATMWQTERQLLQKELDKLRGQFTAEKDRGSQLVAELRTLREEKELARNASSGIEQQLRNELAAAQKEIRELKAVIESQRENVLQWERRVKNCNEFIMQICQPKFSVVKDDGNYTPMTQAEAAACAGTAANGFVMVPLTLMLDAYELLPQDSKKTIASKYEQEKKEKK